MTPKAAGTLVFGILSALGWLLTAYLASRAGASARASMFAWAAGFVALVLTLHTLLYALLADRKARDADWLRRHGLAVQAEVVKIGRRGKGWRVQALAVVPTGTAAPTVFKSDILRADPRPRLAVGDHIQVHLHPTDRRRYWMAIGTESKYL